MMPFALLRQFRKPAQAPPRFLPQRLYYPFASASRMAVIPSGLTPRQMLRYLKGCLAIAAPVEDLALLARAGESGEIHPIPV
ncbi:MAG: hypothetical protein M1541_04665, partial [Acidobacteria bacterium]|nr:hypothetical protein [Acidobacteriota bacterium]